MSAAAFITKNPLLIGGAILAAVAVGWISTRGAAQTGRDLGGGAVDLAEGVLVGVLSNTTDMLGLPRTGDVVDWANSTSNPLQPAGAWLGDAIYNLTH